MAIFVGSAYNTLGGRFMVLDHQLEAEKVDRIAELNFDITVGDEEFVPPDRVDLLDQPGVDFEFFYLGATDANQDCTLRFTMESSTTRQDLANLISRYLRWPLYIEVRGFKPYETKDGCTYSYRTAARTGTRNRVYYIKAVETRLGLIADRDGNPAPNGRTSFPASPCGTAYPNQHQVVVTLGDANNRTVFPDSALTGLTNDVFGWQIVRQDFTFNDCYVITYPNNRDTDGERQKTSNSARTDGGYTYPPNEGPGNYPGEGNTGSQADAADRIDRTQPAIERVSGILTGVRIDSRNINSDLVIDGKPFDLTAVNELQDGTYEVTGTRML